jgi:hypothetical protein
MFGLAPTPSAQGVGKFTPVIRQSLFNGVSPRLRDLPVTRTPANGTWKVHQIRPIHAAHAPPQRPVYDPVQQTSPGLLAIPAPLQTFEGMDQNDGCGNCIPPDPNGAVGPNHYVEMVNSSYSVYTKTGTRLFGPVHINQLWSNLPGPCQANNDGDPVVLYDPSAARWDTRS